MRWINDFKTSSYEMDKKTYYKYKSLKMFVASPQKGTFFHFLNIKLISIHLNFWLK